MDYEIAINTQCHGTLGTGCSTTTGRCSLTNFTLCMNSRPGQRLSTLDIGSKWVETVQAIGFMMQALPLLTHKAGSHNSVCTLVLFLPLVLSLNSGFELVGMELQRES